MTALHPDALYRSLRHSVIYEVNLRQYTAEGTLQAFRPHLRRLASMGVDILWFMPVHPIGIPERKGTLGSYYSVSDFRAVNPEYGAREEFSEMVQEAHQLGMKVIIDWVANHAAWDNVWARTHPAYFVRQEDGRFLSPYDWTDVIQFDHTNEAAHEALRDAMEFWVREMDIDGFRADLAHLTPLPFWLKARERLAHVKPGLIWLGETEDPAYHRAFDISYAWKWMHRTERFFQEHQPDTGVLRALLEQEHAALPENALQLFFTTNHDENSWNGTEFEKYGNYAPALFAFQFYYRNAVPLIYSGQEIPLRRRLAFFDRDPIDWSPGLRYAGFFQRLIQARKRLPDDGSFRWIESSGSLLGYQCGTGVGSVVVVLNLGPETCPFSVALDAQGLWTDVAADMDRETDILRSTLAPAEFAVWQRLA